MFACEAFFVIHKYFSTCDQGLAREIEENLDNS